MFDTDAFDQIAASVDAPLAIVTASDGDERAGCLIGFHNQTSIDPRRYGVWLSKANHTFRVALHSEFLAVHFLTTDDHDLAELFGSLSGDSVDKFAHCAWTQSVHGPPVLSKCANHFVARRTAFVEEGSDHVCFVTEPVDVVSGGPFTPLRVSDVQDLDPAHEAEERPTPDSVRAADAQTA